MAGNVGLALDLMTGLVSPQFHVTFDSSFHAIKQEDIESKWQIKAGFVSALTNQTAKRKQATTHASHVEKETQNINQRSRGRHGALS